MKHDHQLAEVSSQRASLFDVGDGRYLGFLEPGEFVIITKWNHFGQPIVLSSHGIGQTWQECLRML